MFERYCHELLSFIARSTGNRDAARDIVQETFARVLAQQTAAFASGKGAAPAEPRALLFHTAKNIVIDQHRRAQVRDHEDIDEFELPAPAATDPQVALANRQCSDALLEVIASLPPRCREAFVLFKFDGMPQSEIAERMGISRNMVEKHIMAGMLACRRCLGRFDG